jgi:hypothetical protein
VDSAPPKSNVQTPNPAFKPPRKGP